MFSTKYPTLNLTIFTFFLIIFLFRSIVEITNFRTRYSIKIIDLGFIKFKNTKRYSFKYLLKVIACQSERILRL